MATEAEVSKLKAIAASASIILVPPPAIAAPPGPAPEATVYRCEVSHGRTLHVGVTATVDVRGDGNRVKEEQILQFSRGAPGNATGFLRIEFRPEPSRSAHPAGTYTIHFGSKDVPDPIEGRYAQLRLIADDGKEVARLISRDAKDRNFAFPIPELIKIAGLSKQLATEVTIYERDGTLRTTFLTAPLDIAGLKQNLSAIEPVRKAADHIVTTSLASNRLAENCSPIGSKAGNFVHQYKCFVSIKDGRDNIRVSESSGMLDRDLGNDMRFTAEFIHHDPERFLGSAPLSIANFGELRIMGQYNGPDRGSPYRSGKRSYYPPVIAVDLISSERSYRDWGQNNVTFARGSLSTSIWDIRYRPATLTGYIPARVAAYRPNGQWLAQEELDWPKIEAIQKQLLREVLQQEANPVGACEFSKTLMNNPDEIVVIN